MSCNGYRRQKKVTPFNAQDLTPLSVRKVKGHRRIIFGQHQQWVYSILGVGIVSAVIAWVISSSCLLEEANGQYTGTGIGGMRIARGPLLLECNFYQASARRTVNVAINEVWGYFNYFVCALHIKNCPWIPYCLLPIIVWGISRAFWGCPSRQRQWIGSQMAEFSRQLPDEGELRISCCHSWNPHGQAEVSGCSFPCPRIRFARSTAHGAGVSKSNECFP